MSRMNELYAGIALGLGKVDSCAIHMEAIPENEVRPTFLISVLEQKTTYGMGAEIRNLVSVDVMYFPKATTVSEAKRECWEMAEKMSVMFFIPGFKMNGLCAQVTDNILHYRFQTTNRLFPKAEEISMQNLLYLERIKED